MKPWVIRFCVVLLSAAPASARTDEVFTLTPQSQAVLGDGGDSFGMETASKQQVMILLNPDGEDCTLRFPVKPGEGFRVFVRAGLDQRLVCDVSLAGTGKGPTATFSTHCETVTEAARERRCPVAN
jgi:hypothetical protein